MAGKTKYNGLLSFEITLENGEKIERKILIVASNFKKPPAEPLSYQEYTQKEIGQDIKHREVLIREILAREYNVPLNSVSRAENMKCFILHTPDEEIDEMFTQRQLKLF